MRNHPHIRAALYGQPWAIYEPFFLTMCGIYERAIEQSINKLQDEDVPADPLVTDETPIPEEDEANYEIVRGVALLQLEGPLFPKANVFTRISRATSYEEYSRMFDDALARKGVSTICQVIDSPGGSCNGCFETARKVFNARSGSKPVISLITGSGCSAAYAIGVQADRVFCTEGALTGSIGVILRQDNFDRAERNEGNDPLILRSSELKGIGEGPHTPNQIAALRRLLRDTTSLFEAAVQRARPSLDLGPVTTGEVWLGQKAVDVGGLVDEVSTIEQVIEQFGKSG